MTRFRLASLLVVAALATSACRDDRPATTPAPDEPAATLPSGAAQVTVRQLAGGPAGTLTFAVHIVARDLTVSAFQGTVRFAPGMLELVETATPAAGAAGQMFLVNTDRFADGKILFAALTPTVFTGVTEGNGIEAFRFTVRTSRPIAEAGIVATLDAMGQESGETVTSDRMLASPGVVDLSGRLIR